MLALAVASAMSNAARLRPQTSAAFDHYVLVTETRMNADLSAGRFLRIARIPETRAALRAGETRIQPSSTLDNGKEIDVPSGLIQDWIGAMFIPNATIAQIQAVLQDYANYKDFYQPDVTDSKEIAHHGDQYDVFLRLYKKQVLTVVLNTTYHVEYHALDPSRLSVTSRSTKIAQAKDAKNPEAGEEPVGDDLGTLWRLNSYWRFEQSDGGVYAECEAISLSRDIPGLLAWMIRGFVEKFPNESMRNTLRGTKDAVMKRADLPVGR